MEKFKVYVPPMEMTMPDIPKAMMSWRSTMLGVEGESLGNSQLAEYFGVKEGILVRSVIKGTSAEKAGIKAGDVLLKIDDTSLTSPEDITTSIRTARSASKKTLSVVLMREKREMSLPLTLEDESEKMPGRGQRVTDAAVLDPFGLFDNCVVDLEQQVHLVAWNVERRRDLIGCFATPVHAEGQASSCRR